MKKLWLGIGVLLLALALGGCSRYELYAPDSVVDIVDDRSAILEQQEVAVKSTVVDEKITEYRVGPGDVLSVSVPGLFERNGTNDRTRNGQQDDTLGSFRVYTSGKMLLPLVGGVEVAGLTVEEIQGKLIDVFREYMKKPVVSVEILEFKSQPLYLLGKFNNPGLYYLDRPTSLLHGLALGSGLNDLANLRGARLVRSDRVQPVDIYQLLYNNDLSQNVQLHPGDTIYVPGNAEQQVFVFGAVTKPGPVDMANGRLNMVQALSSAGLDGKPYDHQHIRVIRSLSPTRGQLLTVDLGKVVNGRNLPMALMDGDIVYVPKTRMGGWNEIMQELLPTFQLFGAVLQPFVQLEYLSDSDR
jgi:polysaccharide export outer membrane protein